MDPFHGMEVGAEIELNDGTSTLEDHTPIKLENKRDLPLWQHLHHFDDSSSDESLDQQCVDSTPSDAKTLETASHDTKSQVVENYNLEKNIIVLYTKENTQPGHSLVLDNAYSKDLQELASQLAPRIEEPDISCTEVSSASDIGHLHPYSTETSLSYEGNARESSGKYSNAIAKTLCDRSVKPFLRSYKCQRCGREFGRLYNLQHHRCIEMAVRSPQQIGNNIETMNRLEKMCVEAQKELQSLQGQYKKEFVDTQPSFSEIQTWGLKLLSESGRVNPESKCTTPWGHLECESRSQEFHISSDDNSNIFASQSLTALDDAIVVDGTNCSPILLEANQEHNSARQMEDFHPQLDQINGELTNSNQHLFFTTSEENPVDATNAFHDAKQMYKCHQCGEVYNTICSFNNHMHRHKRKFKSNVTNTLLQSSPGSQESYGTTHHVGTTPIDLKNVNCAKATQTFTCEYCGKVFNKRCSYATHTLWHVRRKEHVTVTPTDGAKQETGQVSSLPIRKQNRDRACSSPVEIFTCQSCGRVFNKRCAYSSHSRWHMREQELQKKVIAEAQRVLVDQQLLKEGDNNTTLDHENGISDGDTKTTLDHENGISDADTKTTLDHENGISDADTNKEVSDACLDDGNVQSYCKLVRQLSLDEQCNLPLREQVSKKSEEPSYSLLPLQMETNKRTLPDVLESVLELVVGTEEVHEFLLSEAGLVFRKSEDYGNAAVVVEEVAQVSEIKSELAEEQNSGAQLESEEKLVPAMQSEPAAKQIPGINLEPLKKQVHGRRSEPAEKQVPGTQSEPAEKQVSGMQSEPAEKQVPGMQLEPAKEQYFHQILQSKLAAPCLSRTKPGHRCRDCGVRFKQFWRLRQHRLKGKKLKKHRCDCGRTPIGSLHFLLHQLQHLRDTSFACAVCSKSLRGYRQLQAHSRVHPMVAQFQCKCGTRFTKLPKYLWHSLKNKAKPKAKLPLRGCIGAPF